MTSRAILLDTNFFIYLLQDSSSLNENANKYFKYFCEHNIKMKISTVSIAEYCAGGNFDELPMKNLQVVPFNIDHSLRAGEFAKHVFASRQDQMQIERKLVPNDTQLFAQADIDNSIEFYLSSDTKSKKVYDLLTKIGNVNFKFLDLHLSPSENFGTLF